MRFASEDVPFFQRAVKFIRKYYDAMRAEYTHKKEMFLKGPGDPKIARNDPEGAYYVIPDVSEFGCASGLASCKDPARPIGVGAVPGSSFFREPVNHLTRLHFAKKDETLLEVLNRLESLWIKLPNRGEQGTKA